MPQIPYQIAPGTPYPNSITETSTAPTNPSQGKLWIEKNAAGSFVNFWQYDANYGWVSAIAREANLYTTATADLIFEPIAPVSGSKGVLVSSVSVGVTTSIPHSALIYEVVTFSSVNSSGNSGTTLYSFNTQSIGTANTIVDKSSGSLSIYFDYSAIQGFKFSTTLIGLLGTVRVSAKVFYRYVRSNL